jgi:hypothetical protein
MGDTIWVEIDGRPLEETGTDLSFLLRAIESLDELAVRLGVAKPGGFLDYTELEREAESIINPPEDVDEAMEEVDEAPESVARREAVGAWFDAPAGLATVRALRRHLEAHPNAARIDLPGSDEDKERYRSELMEDLRTCERLVGEAAAEGRRFRLLVVP